MLTLLPCRFTDFLDRSDSGSADESLRAFLRELNSIELSAQKMRAIIEAQKREQAGYEQKQKTLLQQIEEVKEAIESKKGELIEARIIRQQLESYEEPRGRICEVPNRQATLLEQERITKQMTSIEAEGIKYMALIERKKKAISGFFHALTDCTRQEDEPTESELALTRAMAEEYLYSIEPQQIEIEAGEVDESA